MKTREITSDLRALEVAILTKCGPATSPNICTTIFKLVIKASLCMNVYRTQTLSPYEKGRYHVKEAPLSPHPLARSPQWKIMLPSNTRKSSNSSRA
jgi:hypothetical protein